MKIFVDVKQKHMVDMRTAENRQGEETYIKSNYSALLTRNIRRNSVYLTSYSSCTTLNDVLNKCFLVGDSCNITNKERDNDR